MKRSLARTGEAGTLFSFIRFAFRAPVRGFRFLWRHPSVWIRTPFRCGVAVAFLTAILIAPVVVMQDRLVYHPTPYGGEDLPGVGAFRQAHPYIAADGRRGWGMLIEPRPRTGDGGTMPGARGPQFYLCFGGNAATALGEYETYKALAEETGFGFFCLDYRGYGFNGGKPSEAGLTADGLGAYDTMYAEGRLKNGVGLVGHSLGGAVATAVAEKRAVDRLLLLATFTSIEDMAKSIGLGALAPLAWNHWPNERRLREITLRPDGARPRQIVVFHARKDEIVPFSHGERLANLWNGEAVESIPYDIGDHNYIRTHAWADLSRIVKSPLPPFKGKRGGG